MEREKKGETPPDVTYDLAILLKAPATPRTANSEYTPISQRHGRLVSTADVHLGARSPVAVRSIVRARLLIIITAQHDEAPVRTERNSRTEHYNVSFGVSDEPL